MEEEGAVGELEEEEGAVDVVMSDSEEELEVLQQPNLIQKLADVVRLRASCVIELEGGAQLTIRGRPPSAAAHRHPQSACSTIPYHPLHFPLIMPVIAPSLPPSWF